MLMARLMAARTSAAAALGCRPAACAGGGRLLQPTPRRQHAPPPQVRALSTPPTWAPHAKPSLVARAAALAAESERVGGGDDDSRAASGAAATTTAAAATAATPTTARHHPTGAFARLPVVPLPAEHLSGAARRAARARPKSGGAQKAGGPRGPPSSSPSPSSPGSAAAARLDALAQAVCTPLNALARSFPRPSSLHPFEAALLDLTLASHAGGSATEGAGADRYVRTLARLDAGRRAVLETGKGAAAAAARARTKAAAAAAEAAGRAALDAAFTAKAGPPLDALREVAKALRRLPSVEAAAPTLALVGAPNVGKSSIVRALSSGAPAVAAYPFTTRSVSVGHFFVGGARHQVTDTPGLLARPADERNAMERLTLACLAHLPTAVVFVADASGRCGSTPAEQWAVRQELWAAFGDADGRRPWVDVLSKADLVGDALAEADARLAGGGGGGGWGSGGEPPPPPSSVTTAADLAVALPGAVRVAVQEGRGLEDLQAAVLGALAAAREKGWMQ